MNSIHEEHLGAPGFIITLHPLTLKRWQEQPDWQIALSNLIVSTAAEYGTHFHSTPSFELASDSSLEQHEVAISFNKTISFPHAETGALSLSRDDEPGSVEQSTRPIPLLLLKDDKTIQLSGSVINIGRKNSNHIVINDLRVSRNHAQIRKVKDDYVIFDTGSTGGTFINANRIDQHTLRPGDVISLAGYTLIYTIDQIPLDETDKGATKELNIPNEGMVSS